LPLLNLPAPILEALRSGKLEYTKARAIARVRDEEQRKELLDDVIAQDLSLIQIKDRIASIKSETSAGAKNSPLKTQIDDVLRLAKRSKVWDDPKKRKKLEKLLSDLQAVISNAV